MKKTALITLLLFPLAAVQAGVLDMGAGARATGMAEAFTAAADDVSALHYNPAGLVLLTGAELSAQHGEFLKGLSDASSVESNYLGYAQPLKAGRYGAMGFSYQNFKGADYFSDRLFSIGYAREIKTDWLAGVSVKQFHRAYETNPYTANALNDSGVASGQADPLFAKNGMAADSYGVDAGVMHRFGKDKKYTAGAAIMNLNKMDVSVGGHEEPLPMTAKAGVAARPHWGLLSAEVRRTKRLDSVMDTDVAFGAERMVKLENIGAMGFRGGYGQGSRGFKTLTAGFSFRIATVQLDYSFDFPLGNLADTNGHHRAALTFHFGAAVASTESASSTKDHYFQRKAQGASAAERLALLQMLYHEHKDSGADLTWIAKELASL
jgi:hypothetical protein